MENLIEINQFITPSNKQLVDAIALSEEIESSLVLGMLLDQSEMADKELTICRKQLQILEKIVFDMLSKIDGENSYYSIDFVKNIDDDTYYDEDRLVAVSNMRDIPVKKIPLSYSRIFLLFHRDVWREAYPGVVFP